MLALIDTIDWASMALLAIILAVYAPQLPPKASLTNPNPKRIILTMEKLQFLWAQFITGAFQAFGWVCGIYLAFKLGQWLGLVNPT